MSYPTIREILDRTGKRVMGAQWFILFIPILEQLFAALLEQCTNTEEEAVDMISEPTPLQALIAHRRVVGAIRRDGRISRRDRRARAWQIIFAVIEEAREDPQAVCTAFKEVTQKPA